MSSYPVKSGTAATSIETRRWHVMHLGILRANIQIYPEAVDNFYSELTVRICAKDVLSMLDAPEFAALRQGVWNTGWDWDNDPRYVEYLQGPFTRC